MPRKPSKIAQAYRNVFESKDGPAVLADILAHCKVFAPISPGPGGDFDLGARNVGLMIATKLNYRESEFVDLANQHNEALTHE